MTDQESLLNEVDEIIEKCKKENPEQDVEEKLEEPEELNEEELDEAMKNLRENNVPVYHKQSYLEKTKMLLIIYSRFLFNKMRKVKKNLLPFNNNFFYKQDMVLRKSKYCDVLKSILMMYNFNFIFSHLRYRCHIRKTNISFIIFMMFAFLYMKMDSYFNNKFYCLSLLFNASMSYLISKKKKYVVLMTY